MLTYLAAPCPACAAERQRAQDAADSLRVRGVEVVCPAADCPTPLARCFECRSAAGEQLRHSGCLIVLMVDGWSESEYVVSDTVYAHLHGQAIVYWDRDLLSADDLADCVLDRPAAAA